MDHFIIYKKQSRLETRTQSIPIYLMYANNLYRYYMYALFK